MAPANHRLMWTLLLVAVVAVGASACGRKGPLDPPGAALTATDAATTPADATVAKPDKKFILDPLIK